MSRNSWDYQSVIVTDDYFSLKGKKIDIPETKKALGEYLDKCPMNSPLKLTMSPESFIRTCRGIRKILYKEKKAKKTLRGPDSYATVNACANCLIKNKVDDCLDGIDKDDPESILLDVKIGNIKKLGEVPWVNLKSLESFQLSVRTSY